ncbi:MAG: ferritin-like domain-containing protein [Deltaproteobacteria bacterium]|nr:ferritin-like domain-containing protein [Deltaproteobacteria bacterium]
MKFETIDTAVQALWRFDYDSNIKQLRDLYEVAKKEQWNAALDVPWDIKTDPATVGDMSAPNAEPYDFVKALPKDKQIEFAKRRSAHLLSNFLHGEQGAMMICGQLVEVVPDMDAKLYASTQVIDEARHVEVFYRYIQRLDRTYPIMTGLKNLLNAVLQADMWQMKCVGMQVIAESIAMGSFKIMRGITHDEVFKKILELTSQDEARHVSYGLIYMKDAIPKMSEPDRDRLEDFAFAAMTMLATTPQMEGDKRVDPFEQIYAELGIDPARANSEIISRMADPEYVKTQPNPFREYAYPQLERLGLITDRTRSKYREVGLAE